MLRVLLPLLVFDAAVCWARPPPGLERHPRPATVSDGKALHARALAATHRAASRRTWGASVSYNGVAALGGGASARAPSSSSSSFSSSSVGPVLSLNPADFGGDPTGRTDSTAAFAALCAQLFNASSRANNHMASHITDFGGATLDLAGGEFLISAPVLVPVLVGNARITGGTLRASPTFPADRFLVEVGSADCVPADAQGVCNEYIVIHDIMLDAAHVAAGGVVVYHTMGTTVGPSAFLVGFNQAGVRVDGGHETIVSDSWMAEYYWSDGSDGERKANASRAQCQSGTTNGSVGVLFNGEDNYLSNVIIFDFTCTVRA